VPAAAPSSFPEARFLSACAFAPLDCFGFLLVGNGANDSTMLWFVLLGFFVCFLFRVKCASEYWHVVILVRVLLVAPLLDKHKAHPQILDGREKFRHAPAHKLASPSLFTLLSPPFRIDKKADVAQLVEQPIRNRQVSGSSPLVGSILSPLFMRLALCTP
jgi:hypothetical protein